MQMDTALDFSKAQPVTLDASVSASKLELNALLTIESAKIPRAGDDIKISFNNGLVAYAAVMFLNADTFPVIGMSGGRFVLVPSGRTKAGMCWLLTKY